MSTLEIFLNVIGSAIMGYFISLLGSKLTPKFKAKAIKAEEIAKNDKIVKADKFFLSFFLYPGILCNLIGVIIIAFPKLIKEVFEFNYIATIIVWWIPMIFNNVIFYFLFTEVRYNDEEIIVKKPLRKVRKYKIDEIISFTKKRNLIIKTTQGKIFLFRALSGTESLREFLIKNRT